MNYLFKLSPLLTLIPLFLIAIGLYFQWLKIVILGLGIFYFLFFFFRVPKRGMVSNHKNPILSPCYGTIKDIKEVGDYNHIVITLSLFDPHIQYVPYNGIVRRKMYKKGEFNMAYMLSKSQHNERMVTQFDTNIGDITVSQIAGMLTRRIHNFLLPLQRVLKGEPLGFICFGSRVDILFNKNPKIRLNVTKGERVIGGETVLAYVY